MTRFRKSAFRGTSQSRRRVRVAAAATMVESLERRALLCAFHSGDFQWINPDSRTSLATARRTIAGSAGQQVSRSIEEVTARATSDAVGIPELNSLPGAPTAIFLDFDGDTGTSTTAYDTNGDPNVFDSAEAAVITGAWTSVSTYFAMFNVNVTTVAPTVPFAWHISGNNINGGYSAVGAFPNSPTDVPRSFNNSGDARTRHSGIAHEVGHNFGLWHQSDFNSAGQLVNEYSSGYDLQHGPFMGVDYAQRVHKWFYGHPNTGATDIQDDLGLIASKIAPFTGGGDGYRPDDFGSSINPPYATLNPTSGGGFERSGIIERRTDVDLFQFQSAGGRYLINANQEIESGLDLKLEVLNFAGAIVASEDLPGSLEANLALDLPSGPCTVRISSHGNYGDVGKYKITVTPLPANMDSADVGSLKRPGTVAYNPSTGVYTLVAGGDDVWTDNDEERFVYHKLTGDGSVTARITGLTNTGDHAKAGLDIRESLLTGSRHAMNAIKPNGSAQLVYRTDNNGQSSAVDNFGQSTPIWLRLTRSGNTLTAERSGNGSSWTTIGSTTINFGNTVLIGLIASAFSNDNPTTATFDNVSFTGALGEPARPSNGLPAVGGVSIAPVAGTGSGLNVTWNAVAGATGYLIERSSDGTNFTQAGTTSGATSFADNNLPGSYRYFYRVYATNGSPGVSALHNLVYSGVNRPSAVTNITTMTPGGNTVVIDWRDTLGETGYRVERSNDEGQSWFTIATTGPNVNTVIDNSGPAAATYRFRIIPLSAAGDGAAVENVRLGVVQNVRVTQQTPSSLALAWNDLNSVETSYRIERSLDNSTWTTVNTVNGNTNSYLDSGLSSLTGYYYRITALASGLTALEGGRGTGATLPTAPAQSLPTGWSTVDVGAVGGPGASGSSGGTYTVLGSGVDIWNTADSFRFTYRRMTGDGEIIARVATLSDTDQYTKAGVMIRESLAAGSKYAFAHMTPRITGLQYERRATTNGNSVSSGGLGRAVPVWVRLVRAGNAITGYYSLNGTNWVSMGAENITMSGTIYVGLALTAHNNSAMATATFTDVGGSLTTQSDTTAPATPTINFSTDTGQNASDRITNDQTLVLSGNAEAGATVQITRNGSAIGSTQANYLGSWTFDMTASSLAGGDYVFGATAIDGSNNSSTPVTTNVTVDTVAPTLGNAVFTRDGGLKWTVQFSENIGTSLGAGEFLLVNTTTGQSYVPQVSYNAATATATVSYPTSLADGRYEVRMASGLVTDIAGNPLAAPYASAFNILNGDVNGDGTVNFGDLLLVAQNYGATGKTYAQGNIDLDAGGNVNFADLLMLAQAYGQTLAPQAPAAIVASDTTSSAKRRATATVLDSAIV